MQNHYTCNPRESDFMQPLSKNEMLDLQSHSYGDLSQGFNLIEEQENF